MRRPTSRPLQWQNYELGYELIPHPPYSPDLAPCDFFLFPNLKIWLGGKKFSSNEEVIVAVNEYFVDFETAYFKWLPIWTMRPFWLKFGLKEFEEWIFRDVAS